MYNYVIEAQFLLIFKIRFALAVWGIMPLNYLSAGMILFFMSLNEKYKKLQDKRFSQKIQFIVIFSFGFIITIIIAIFLNLITLRIILPIIVVPSMIVITIIFYLAYRNKRLSQVNPKILSIGFGIYLLSTILRPLFYTLWGETEPAVHFFVEIIDLIVYITIFLGLITKVLY
jgi:hypothetical protein